MIIFNNQEKKKHLHQAGPQHSGPPPPDQNSRREEEPLFHPLLGSELGSSATPGQVADITPGFFFSPNNGYPAHHTSHHASFSTQWISPTPHLPGFLHLLCHQSTAVQLALGQVPSPAKIVMYFTTCLIQSEDCNNSNNMVRFKPEPQISTLPCHWRLGLVGQIVSHLGHHLSFHCPRNL